MKWTGLILMLVAAVVYWISAFNDLAPIFTNISIVLIALGAAIMTVGVVRGKRGR